MISKTQVSYKVTSQETAFILHWLDAQIEQTEHILSLMSTQPNITDANLGEFIKASILQELQANRTYSSLNDMLCRFATNRIDWESVAKQFKANWQHEPIKQTVKLVLSLEQQQAMKY